MWKVKATRTVVRVWHSHVLQSCRGNDVTLSFAPRHCHPFLAILSWLHYFEKPAITRTSLGTSTSTWLPTPFLPVGTTIFLLCSNQSTLDVQSTSCPRCFSTAATADLPAHMDENEREKGVSQCVTCWFHVSGMEPNSNKWKNKLFRENNTRSYRYSDCTKICTGTQHMWSSPLLCLWVNMPIVKATYWTVYDLDEYTMDEKLQQLQSFDFIPKCLLASMLVMLDTINSKLNLWTRTTTIFYGMLQE